MLELLRERICPACDYDLRGSTGVGNCPECGFVYGTEYTCLRPSANRRRCYLFSMFLILCYVSFLLVKVLVVHFPTWPPFSCVFLVLPVFQLLTFFYRHCIQYNYRYEFILIERTKIQWRLSGCPEISNEWAKVKEVRSSQFLDSVSLTVQGSSRSVWIPRRLRPKSMRLEEFTALIERYWLQTRDSERKRG